MPQARGNQPSSTGSNYNVPKGASTKIPKRNKKAKFRKVPKVAKKAKIDNQQSAIINKLSKQVHSLQMAKYGKVQQNYHTLRTALLPTGAKPCCLDLTDFTCYRTVTPGEVGATSDGAIVYQHTGGNLPSEISKWTVVPYQDNYYWNVQNLDAPDGGAYLAMNATYFVEVQGINALDNTRVRFDVISQKASGIIDQPGAQLQVLPNTLKYMKHLAQPMGANSNRINPVYFKKYFSKTVFINSQPPSEQTTGFKTHATTANIIRFSFKLKPNKLCTQRKTNPTVSNIDPQNAEPRGNFGPYNVHPCQPLWLVISTDDQSTIGDAVQVNISRRIMWRDPVGQAIL